MAIRILNAEVASRIAAGEVVERPSSVAKELIENALDAGATSITVEIKAGGIEYLRVTDNGLGIAPEDVRLAFQNHATSKIKSAEELDDIRTLGFRGEALPSIAAVAKVECVTRQRGAQVGVKAVIEGGRFLGMSEAGCPEGTTIILRDLFFNTPVRKAFLKKPTYEAGVLTDMAMRLLLGNPGVAVRVINNSKTIYHSFGDGNIRHAALAAYGKQTAEQLLSMDEAEGGMRLHGLLGVGECARPTRSQQSFFINGRLVRSLLLTQALETACRGRVTIGMTPMCILNLALPPHSVDVNVHPNKLEVRFRDEASVRQSAQALFERAFEGERMLDLSEDRSSALPDAPKLTVEKWVEVASEPMPSLKTVEKQTEKHTKQTEVAIETPPVLAQPALPLVSTPLHEPAPRALNEESGLWKVPERMTKEPKAPAPLTPTSPQTALAPSQTDQAEEKKEKAEFRVIGAALNTYLLVETSDALILIDQHAAHERILYEKLVPQLEGAHASQRLLTPLVLPVSTREMAQIEENVDLLEHAGFEVEPFGEKALAVRAVPFVLGQADLAPLFLEMLDRLDQLRYATEEKRRAALIQMACKHAVKAGDALSTAEIRELVEAMRETQAPATCPHGRPVARKLSKKELERMFKRQQ